MSRIQYYAAVSIDGFIAGPGDAMDWLGRLGPSAAKDRHFRSFISGVGAMAMGATTYRWAYEHVYRDEPGRWQQDYGQLPCWVFTRRRLPALPATNVTFVAGDPRDARSQMMKAAQGKLLKACRHRDRASGS